MSRTTRNLLIAAAFVLAGVLPACAQVNTQNHTTANTPNRMPDNPIPTVYGGYQIGVGDILDIHVNDEDDVSGHYQVDQDGNVKISLLSKPLPAAGSHHLSIGHPDERRIQEAADSTRTGGQRNDYPRNDAKRFRARRGDASRGLPDRKALHDHGLDF